MIERIMEITCPKNIRYDDFNKTIHDTIDEVHTYLTNHLDERVTISELAKKFLINPTTLKEAFKKVYGNSIAAHIKEHRMEKACELLRDTSDNILEIAKKVGYENQIKFSETFKEYYKMLPTEYRKNKQKNSMSIL